MHKIQLIIGAFITIIGLFWACQGYGLIQWPANSFMIDARPWVYYGGLTALAGIMIIWLSWRHQ